MAALEEIATERKRQIKTEGWTRDHDDAHSDGQLAHAAACYADFSALNKYLRIQPLPRLIWPWDISWWKPTDRRRDLVKAGALIVAEIERLDRAERRKCEDDRTTLVLQSRFGENHFDE
jgi:hypothetical protein